MAVRIRLARHGRKKRPFYRIVAADSESPRDGRYIERLGTYDPMVDPPAVSVDEEKVLKWLSRGAKPTETVKNLLKREGVWQKFIDTKSGSQGAA